MKKVILSLFTIITLCSLCQAQITHNPYYWDQPLSYNPASVGALVDESVQMSLTTSSGPGGTWYWKPDLLLPSEIHEQGITEVKNLYYLSYQKTHSFASKKKLTLGLQFQKAQSAIEIIQKNSTLGLTTNFHIPRSQNKHSERYWSFGMQMNLLFRRPNTTVVDFIYHNLPANGLEMDRIAFENKFKNTGLQSSIGTNYMVHKFHNYYWNLGIKFTSLQYQVIDDSKADTILYPLTRKTIHIPSASLGVQKSIGAKFMIEINVFSSLRTRRSIFSKGSIYVSESSLGLGFGFQLPKENILRLALLSNYYSGLQYIRTSSCRMGIDYKNYSIGLSLSRFNYNWPRRTRILQVDINYKLGNEVKPRLLRINN